MPPIPAPSPSPVSGSGWVTTSGNTQTSGVAATHAEYTQWLTIDYHRNPYHAHMASQNQFHNLTSVSGTDTGSVYGTALHIVITAHNSCKFVTAAYNTSAYYQPQKFQIAPRSYDRFGTSYGAVSGGASGVGDYLFGPQGTIITTQPHIRRAAKTATDVEYSLTQVGTNYASTAVSGAGMASGIWHGNNFDQGGEFRTYLDFQTDVNRNRWQPGTAAIKRKLVASNDNYQMYGGGYQTSSEVAYGASGANNAQGLQRFISFLEDACGILSDSDYHRRYVNNDVLYSQGSGYLLEDDKLIENPYYNTSQHSYT